MKRLIFVGILVVGVAIWAFIWWQSPAETKNFTSYEQTGKSVLGSEVTLVAWQTRNFTTSYPDNLRVITSNEVAHGNTSGQYLLGTASLKQTDQLAVTVGSLQGTMLNDLPAIRLRQQHTDTYQPTHQSFLPDDSIAFSSTDDYEVAVFWQNEGRYAAVVASGSIVRQAELDQALEAIITHWQWRD